MVLTEIASVPVYQCGECGVTLRGKKDSMSIALFTDKFFSCTSPYELCFLYSWQQNIIVLLIRV